MLVVVWGWVAWKSFESGSWLLGWDNLVPELDFGLEFKRLLWGVWQEYRGVGVLGGMAHIADLPRVIILWLLHWVVPKMYLRWVWHLGMLLLGPVGVWIGLWLMAYGLWKKEVWLRNLVGLVGGLFYLLNPATLQYFYTPFETFSSFYGFFPWLMGLAIVYLQTGEKKWLKWLGVVGFLGTSAFYVQTLFVVYVLVLSVWLLVFSIGGIWSQNRLRNLVLRLKQVTNLILVVVVVNVFWLLPVIYFTLTNSWVTKVNHINSIATPETALMNQAFGGWQDVLGLRGYWLEYGDWKGEKYTRLMDGGWYEWLMKPEVKRVATGMGILAFSFLFLVFGFGVWFWFQNRLSRQVGINSTVTNLILDLGLVGTILLAWLMMGSYNPPFGFVYGWLVEHVPLFGEIFRSVFTKWSMVMAWGMSLGIGMIVWFVGSQNRLRNLLLLPKEVTNLILGVLLMGTMGYVMWPVFKQGMIYDRMKVKIPQEYFEMFEFFKHESVGRVAYFPVQTFWGWDFLRWGYRGSGFLWYGMEQPILHRSFDVWSSYNEGFYREISEAVYNCDERRVTSDGGSQNRLRNTHLLPNEVTNLILGSDQDSGFGVRGDVKSQTALQSAEGSGPSGLTPDKELNPLSRSGGADPYDCVSWVGGVLKKYDVEYVLLDRSVFEPGKSDLVLRIPEIERVMDELGERVFEKGFLTVWKLDFRF